MNKSFRFQLALLFFVGSSILVHAAGKDSIQYEIGVSGLASTGKFSPFWLQSNQYGKISSDPLSTNLQLGVAKDYGHQKKAFDYGFKFNAIGQIGNNSHQLFPQEYYLKARLWFMDFSAGAREEIYGNQDESLSCGGFLFSKNSRPIPKLHAGIDHFTTIPFTFSLLEIKGGVSNGWFIDNIYASGAMMHHKYLYGRIGGKGPVHFQYGLDHAAEWGGNVPGYGPQPSGLKDFFTIFMGHSGGSGGEHINALGNHIISQSMRLDARISQFSIGMYWQNLSEDGPVRFMAKAMNVSDGLWGISIRNKTFPIIKGFVYEYLNTTDQSGPYHDKDGIVYGGSDSYFQNYVYNEGWSYFSRTIGTPFISSPLYTGNVYSNNTRVQVHHFAMEGAAFKTTFKAMASFSKNYGTYGGYFNSPNQSYLIELNKQISSIHNIELSASFGLDAGKLYGNSTGLLISIKKTGNLFNY